jgi:hypothetical protein
MSVELSHLLVNWYTELQALFCTSCQQIETYIQTSPSLEFTFLLKQFKRLQTIWSEMEGAASRMKRHFILLPQDFDDYHNCFQTEFSHVAEKVQQAFKARIVCSPALPSIESGARS